MSVPAFSLFHAWYGDRDGTADHALEATMRETRCGPALFCEAPDEPESLGLVPDRTAVPSPVRRDNRHSVTGVASMPAAMTAGKKTAPAQHRALGADRRKEADLGSGLSPARGTLQAHFVSWGSPPAA